MNAPTLPLAVLMALVTVPSIDARSIPTGVQDAAPTAEARGPKQDASKRRRFAALPGERQKRLRQIAKRVRDLPPERRAALLERLGRLNPNRTEELKQRVRKFNKRPLRERKQLRARAKRLEQIDRHLTRSERESLRGAAPKERNSLLQRHSRQLLEQFKRSLNPARRREFAQLPHPEKMKRFDRYLSQPRAALRHDRSVDRQRQLDQRRRRVQRIQNQLRRLPGIERFRLIENPELPEIEVPMRLRKDLENLTPRERQRLKQSLRKRQPTRRSRQ